MGPSKEKVIEGPQLWTPPKYLVVGYLKAYPQLKIQQLEDDLLVFFPHPAVLAPLFRKISLPPIDY
jgi:hypothetical protein